MSKKFVVTSLAALSLSLFAGPSVLAETVPAASETVVGETGSQDQRLDQLLAVAQSLQARLAIVLASEEPLPVNPENRQFLIDTIQEINTIYDALLTQEADESDLSPLHEMRVSLFKLYLLQYEMPDLYTAILTQVPTLEDKRYDDAVDFHDFDAELDDLLAKTSYLSQFLDYVQENLEPEDVAKDQAYLTEVNTYLSKLQEELYAPEGETVEVPVAPVYWNEEAVPPTEEQPGDQNQVTDTPEESGDQGSTESGTATVTEPSPETTDTGSTESTEASGDQGSTEPNTTTSTEFPSDTTDNSSTDVAEGTGTQPSPEAGTATGEVAPSDAPDNSAPAESGSTGSRSDSSGSANPGAGQTPPPAHVPNSPQQNQQSGQGQSGQTPSPTHQSTEASVTVATSQTKAVLPTTADEANEFYLLAGLFLASLGLASMKRRQA